VIGDRREEVEETKRTKETEGTEETEGTDTNEPREYRLNLQTSTKCYLSGFVFCLCNSTYEM
jgi:hypothetical protein